MAGNSVDVISLMVKALSIITRELPGFCQKVDSWGEG